MRTRTAFPIWPPRSTSTPRSGYEQVGRVDLGANASLTMLKFPGEEVVTLELVHRPEDGPVDIGTGFSHIPVQVDDLARSEERRVGKECRSRGGPCDLKNKDR